MTNLKINNRSLSILLVTLMVVALLTACSGKNTSEANQPSSSSLSAAQIPQAALPKQAQPVYSAGDAQPVAAEPAQAPEAAQPAAPEAAAVAPSAMAAAPTDAPQASSVQPAAAVVAQPQPVVDLSIPTGPSIGNRAPEFTLQGVDGQSYRMSDLVGKTVVINYWTTWCIPCKTELPIIQRIAQEYAPRGVVVLTVNAIEQDSLDKVQALIGEMGMQFPVLLDKGNQFASSYEAMFFPTTYFVDSTGVIRHINLGDASEDELRGAIDNLLMGGS